MQDQIKMDMFKQAIYKFMNTSSLFFHPRRSIQLIICLHVDIKLCLIGLTTKENFKWERITWKMPFFTLIFSNFCAADCVYLILSLKTISREYVLSNNKR